MAVSDSRALATTVVAVAFYLAVGAATANFDPKRMSMLGRIGGYAQKRLYDPVDTTKAARSAFLRGFLADIDPELPERERLRRAEAAKKEHMARLAYLSAQKRQAKKR
jgi:hypothetical protein